MSLSSDASPITVLLIDSYKADREYWAQQLRMSSPDYAVLEADDGGSGLALCQLQKVDCVVVELTVRDMSGFHVLLRLVQYAREPERAVIILSRTKLQPMVDLTKKNGAQAFLFKELTSYAELDMAIRKAIAASAKPKERRPQRHPPSDTV